jgi:hypothetical protein
LLAVSALAAHRTYAVRRIPSILVWGCNYEPVHTLLFPPLRHGRCWSLPRENPAGRSSFRRPRELTK